MSGDAIVPFRKRRRSPWHTEPEVSLASDVFFAVCGTRRVPIGTRVKALMVALGAILLLQDSAADREALAELARAEISKWLERGARIDEMREKERA